MTLSVTQSQFLGALDERLTPPLKAVRAYLRAFVCVSVYVYIFRGQHHGLLLPWPSSLKKLQRTSVV
jgi:hypothetical protein